MNTKKDKQESKSDKQIPAAKAENKLRSLEQEAEKERSKKPGSQSNSSDRHNTGRGGGK